MTDTYKLSLLLAFQAPVICLAICGYLFFSLRRNGVTQKQFHLLRLMFIGCVGSMLCELLCGLVTYRALDWDIHCLIPLTSVGYSFLLFNTITLNEFCISRIENPSALLRRLIRMVYLLTGLVLLARFVFSDSEYFLYITENGKILYGKSDDLQTWFCGLTDMLLSLLILNKYLDKREYVNRERNGKMLFSAVTMTGTILLYVMLYIPYIIWMGFMLVLMIQYTGLQRLMIDHDELTSLSNRRRMLKDIEKKYKAKENWGFIIFDVNSFKHINDNYGHNEGDHALTIVSDILDGIAREKNTAAYRIGGDEFAVLLSTNNENEALAFCTEVDEALFQITKEAALSYPLTVSYGYTMYGSGDLIDIPDIMESADRKMYAYKRIIKESR